MADLNEFNISKEELEEIQAIKELAQDCTELLISSLVNPDTNEVVSLDEEQRKLIFKMILDKTMEYTEENEIPDGEEDFIKFVDYIFAYMQEQLG